MESDKSQSLDQDVPRAFTPDVLLPNQFFGSAGAKTFSSEQRLMLAVLVDAINLVLREKHRESTSFKEASSWIFARSVARWLSFEMACDAVGLNADWLRKRLSELVLQRVNFDRVRLKEQAHSPVIRDHSPQ
ncbi:MAG: hypothetical protein WBY93_10450 [Candidatus Binatus sp.]